MFLVSELWDKWFRSPEECRVCGSPLGGGVFAGEPHRVCNGCLERLEPICGGICRRCGRPMRTAGVCRDCLRRSRRELDVNRACFRYTSFTRDCIHFLKYRGQETLARPFGSFLAAAVEEWKWRGDLVTYVPLHPEKYRERGFNQAELLAREMGRRLWIPVRSLLIRVRSTSPQSRRNRSERIRELQGSFALSDLGKRLLRTNRRILVVDDVYTTGTTLNECAKVLKDGGASRVDSVTVAR
ncbi:amidophosphoribosyltransferase [Marinithermofilum abyssi]|uniref:Amidophosphoribosyltransferase n=1 Tax=Marinithermofilum abyssi TaxID=1571185 RepID=A0A8J2VH08_9BACL|nr:ComF family protein [Marinithermofilum abyssi]GGE04814.1 amidophosphoribosyltransferase [Marinithermofilum abyssi]